ncbi:glycoside hydrolase family 99-like domain-containing protein [Robertkochia solimangrovi]|uniref:glycoside hydrolase family 99-like domain-containing protein n=1 Tax=Robertkochia solimangrovi TaxID=2213046 RepID=UPI00117E3C96|nr:glycoside hydrolase family 99-like domain-containing protein [Robertkochia solimangrovi]TRZ44975.1 glycosyl hydrolase [Robertkochia solimangrovi]
MDNLKLLSIYLPQFHPIPENDKAWGEGFTEWTNVKKSKPLFDGHYQPHVPHSSIGYYDLEDPNTLVEQAKLAREYGIYGFAYYHYWFNGKRLLNLPIDNMLSQKKPDFPFCLIWANENWTKRWDGKDEEVIMKQDYSLEDDKEHMEFLCNNVFNDERYICVDDKPVFIIYKTELFPDIKKTVDVWRKTAKEHGFKDLYLVRVESISRTDPSSIEFDAAMEFAPDWNSVQPSTEHQNLKSRDYALTVFNMLLKKYDYKVYRSVFPGWDNTARRGENATIFLGANNDIFEYFLKCTIQNTLKLNKNEQFLFVNAWNEWAEGCHLEPDEKNGFKTLDIIKRLTSNKESVQLYNQYLNALERAEKVKSSNSYKLGNAILNPFSRIKKILNG